MQNNTTQHSNDKQPVTYVKPTITAYDVATIRQALGPAVGFSTGRSTDDDDLLFGDDS